MSGISFEEAQGLVEEHATQPHNRVARIAGVPAVALGQADGADWQEQWVTIKEAYCNMESSTDRFWVPGGLAVHTHVRIAPGISVDVAYLYLFPPPEGMFDLFNEGYR